MFLFFLQNKILLYHGIGSGKTITMIHMCESAGLHGINQIVTQASLIGSFYNEIGLNANFNMKREAIGDGESSLNEDSLLPLCEQMLQCRQEDIDKLNKMFGTNISVDFDSAWKNNQKSIKIELEKAENEASQLAEGGDENEGIQVVESNDEGGENETSQLAESCDEDLSNEGGDELEDKKDENEASQLAESCDEDLSNEGSDEDEDEDEEENN